MPNSDIKDFYRIESIVNQWDDNQLKVAAGENFDQYRTIYRKAIQSIYQKRFGKPLRQILIAKAQEDIHSWDDARLRKTAETTEFQGYNDTYQTVIRETYRRRFQHPIQSVMDPHLSMRAIGLSRELQMTRAEQERQKHLLPSTPNPQPEGGVKWCYNKYGHIELWEDALGEGESDLYFQTDTDVDAFLKHIGLDPDDINPGDCDIAEDPGYFD